MCFWRAQKVPQALRGLHDRVVGHWSGPANILGRKRSMMDGEDCRQGFWVAYKGTLVLVAAEHLRSAMREEALADAV